LTKKIVLESGIVLKAQIWDSSGSERYRSITVGHNRSAVGALLVFDLTDRESLDNLPYWNLVVALIGNDFSLIFQQTNATWSETSPTSVSFTPRRSGSSPRKII
jgi:GTPase SAR1 family protein